MSIAVGDIVTVKQRDGFWAVMAPDSTPANPEDRHWHLQQDRAGASPLGHTAGAGDMTVIASPSFSPGMKLRHDGETCIVVEDRGDLILVFIERYRQLEGGRINLNGNTPVSRGALVAENINQLRQT